MRDKPEAEALLDIAEQVLRETVIPHVGEGARYDVLMVANAISIARRQAQTGDLEDAFAETLIALLGQEGSVEQLTHLLAQLIRAGNAPEGTLEALKDITAAKLAESNPRYLGRVLTGR